MEATSTRRAGLERFTFPEGSKPYFVLGELPASAWRLPPDGRHNIDLSNDLPDSFVGGTMDIDPQQGRITIGGKWGSRYVPKDNLNDILILVLSAASGLEVSVIKLSRVMTF